MDSSSPSSSSFHIRMFEEGFSGSIEEATDSGAFLAYSEDPNLSHTVRPYYTTEMDSSINVMANATADPTTLWGQHNLYRQSLSHPSSSSSLNTNPEDSHIKHELNHEQNNMAFHNDATRLEDYHAQQSYLSEMFPSHSSDELPTMYSPYYQLVAPHYQHTQYPSDTNNQQPHLQNVPQPFLVPVYNAPNIADPNSTNNTLSHANPNTFIGNPYSYNQYYNNLWCPPGGALVPPTTTPPTQSSNINTTSTINPANNNVASLHNTLSSNHNSSTPSTAHQKRKASEANSEKSLKAENSQVSSTSSKSKRKVHASNKQDLDQNQNMFVMKKMVDPTTPPQNSSSNPSPSPPTNKQRISPTPIASMENATKNANAVTQPSAYANFPSTSPNLSFHYPTQNSFTPPNKVTPRVHNIPVLSLDDTKPPSAQKLSKSSSIIPPKNALQGSYNQSNTYSSGMNMNVKVESTQISQTVSSPPLSPDATPPVSRSNMSNSQSNMPPQNLQLALTTTSPNPPSPSQNPPGTPTQNTTSTFVDLFRAMRPNSTNLHPISASHPLVSEIIPGLRQPVREGLRDFFNHLSQSADSLSSAPSTNTTNLSPANQSDSKEAMQYPEGMLFKSFQSALSYQVVRMTMLPDIETPLPIVQIEENSRSGDNEISNTPISSETDPEKEKESSPSIKLSNSSANTNTMSMNTSTNNNNNNNNTANSTTNTNNSSDKQTKGSPPSQVDSFSSINPHTSPPYNKSTFSSLSSHIQQQIPMSSSPLIPNNNNNPYTQNLAQHNYSRFSVPSVHPYSAHVPHMQQQTVPIQMVQIDPAQFSSSDQVVPPPAPARSNSRRKKSLAKNAQSVSNTTTNTPPPSPPNQLNQANPTSSPHFISNPQFGPQSIQKVVPSESTSNSPTQQQQQQQLPPSSSNTTTNTNTKSTNNTSPTETLSQTSTKTSPKATTSSTLNITQEITPNTLSNNPSLVTVVPQTPTPSSSHQLPFSPTMSSLPLDAHYLQHFTGQYGTQANLSYRGYPQPQVAYYPSASPYSMVMAPPMVSQRYGSQGLMVNSPQISGYPVAMHPQLAMGVLDPKNPQGLIFPPNGISTQSPYLMMSPSQSGPSTLMQHHPFDSSTGSAELTGNTTVNANSNINGSSNSSNNNNNNNNGTTNVHANNGNHNSNNSNNPLNMNSMVDNNSYSSDGYAKGQNAQMMAVVVMTPFGPMQYATPAPPNTVIPSQPSYRSAPPVYVMPNNSGFQSPTNSSGATGPLSTPNGNMVAFNNYNNAAVKKRRRSSFNESQTKILNTHFVNRKNSGAKFAPNEIQDIASEAGLSAHQVKIFFQNRRARSKSQDLDALSADAKEKSDETNNKNEEKEKDSSKETTRDSS